MGKVCYRCKLEKPLESFNCQRYTRDGKDYLCKVCSRLYAKAWRERNKDKERGYNKRKSAKLKGTALSKYYVLRRRSREIGHSFLWTRDEFITWYNSQEKVCHYCKVKLQNQTRRGGDLTDVTFDRKNPNKGYEKDNIVLACRRCNVMKGNWLSEKQMLDAGRRYFKR